MDPILLVAEDGPVTTLTLNRPERLNAFTQDLHRDLRAALAHAAANKQCRVVLITGAGRGFCAGQDLSDRAVIPAGESQRRDLGASLETFYNPLVRAMRHLPKPIVVAVNGVAAGAGANFALHGDIVLAAKSAKFIQAFIKIGLMPDAGGTWSLTHLLGEARAKALAMTGEPLSATQAAEWGLIWRVVEDEALMMEAHTLARTLAAQPSGALAAIKSAIHAASVNSLDVQLNVERDGQREIGKSDDYLEGVAAFLEKRAPKFQ